MKRSEFTREELKERTIRLTKLILDEKSPEHEAYDALAKIVTEEFGLRDGYVVLSLLLCHAADALGLSAQGIVQPMSLIWASTHSREEAQEQYAEVKKRVLEEVQKEEEDKQNLSAEELQKMFEA